MDGVISLFAVPQSAQSLATDWLRTNAAAMAAARAPSGAYGRFLDGPAPPAQVTEWQSPSGAKSEPYGIVFTKGALWYSESFAKPNTVVRFDPQTQKFQTWALPGGGDIVRNMDVTRDGNPVLANSLVNEVTLVEIK